MNVSEYDYRFPESAIAIRPPEVRGMSKLFVVFTQTGEIMIDQYDRLDKYLTEKDVLVRNITKVFHARLFGNPITHSGEKLTPIEIFLTEPHAQSLDEYAKRQYIPKEKGFKLEFLAAKRKLKLYEINHIDFGDGYLMKSIVEKGESFEGIFCKENGELLVDELFKLFEKKGKVPLPPYIKRDTDAADDLRYQTIFARKLGSVAAPTASLNFTNELENRLVAQGTDIKEVTLHVGRGTFLPLRDETIEKNILHKEPFYVSRETISALHNAKYALKRVVAMGTTTTRTLETIAHNILDEKNGAVGILSETQLFIYPPYNFQVVDGLLTNFHFPKSSLITLVDAFLQYKKAKLSWRQIYDFAIEYDAKLFSYGDSMLLI